MSRHKTGTESTLADTLAPLSMVGVEGSDIITTDDLPDFEPLEEIGPNTHGLGPDTAGGPNPDYVPEEDVHEAPAELFKKRTQAEIDLEVLAEAQEIRQNPERCRAARAIAGGTIIQW